MAIGVALMYSEYRKTRQAADEVEARMGLYVHAGVFVVVCSGLALLNWYTSPDVIWAIWVFLGWGLGVLLHVVLVFGRWPTTVRTWQLRKIRSVRAQMR